MKVSLEPIKTCCLPGISIYSENIINKERILKMKPTPREIQEATAYYERVIEHPPLRGLYKDREGAEKIIEGMSEEWYSLIVTD